MARASPRQPQIARRPRCKPLSRANGARLAKAAIRLRSNVPSSGRWVTRVRATTRPTPGMACGRSRGSDNGAQAFVAVCRRFFTSSNSVVVVKRLVWVRVAHWKHAREVLDPPLRLGDREEI